jgi:hypothetical protein
MVGSYDKLAIKGSGQQVKRGVSSPSIVLYFSLSFSNTSYLDYADLSIATISR